VDKDDYYMGYRIPKGSGVVHNVWSINHDEKRYPEPREFRPERYEGDRLKAGESAALRDATNRDHNTLVRPRRSKHSTEPDDAISVLVSARFGAGRRLCPGLNVAERSLFLGISRMLWAFNISPEIDADGNPIPVYSGRISQGIVARPEPFQCKIEPRNAERKAIVRQEWEDEKEALIAEGMPV
jgi:hypothetical protein